MENFLSKEDKSFVGRKTVNGVEIIVEWDKGYKDYVICLPQIELNKVEGVEISLCVLLQNQRLQNKFLSILCNIAETEPDVYKVFKSVEEFSKNLPY